MSQAKLRELVTKYYGLKEQLDAYVQQYNAYEIETRELDELKKFLEENTDVSHVYKSMGGVLVKVSRDTVLEEVKQRLERLENIKKLIKSKIDELEKLLKETESKIRAEQLIASGGAQKE
ncbi:MAG: prefoldin subunit [Desulfurococcales archaeon]|nr:prefoldin subunit [Desulfurococcales archaeon]